jgi:hypothetical protein
MRTAAPACGTSPMLASRLALGTSTACAWRQEREAGSPQGPAQSCAAGGPWRAGWQSTRVRVPASHRRSCSWTGEGVLLGRVHVQASAWLLQVPFVTGIIVPLPALMPRAEPLPASPSPPCPCTAGTCSSAGASACATPTCMGYSWGTATPATHIAGGMKVRKRNYSLPIWFWECQICPSHTCMRSRTHTRSMGAEWTVPAAPTS